MYIRYETKSKSERMSIDSMEELKGKGGESIFKIHLGPTFVQVSL